MRLKETTEELRQNVSTVDLESALMHAEAVAIRRSDALKAQHAEKLRKLRERRQKTSIQVDKSSWVRNFSSRDLTEEEIRVLRKGLSFAMAPATLD